MDFKLMQWRDQQQQREHQSNHQAVGKDRKQDQQQEQQSLSALSLFLTEPVSKVGIMSGLLDTPSASKFPKMMMMGGQFSSAQWQELELQAVIFRYMLAGASVPAELLQPIKNSLLNSSSFFLHHPLQHYSNYQPAATVALLQSGYWGRAGMDPEPGRCRRTDGKKWRCSRDVAPGHKYCDRHMNRGRMNRSRNRSRKPVELPKPRTNMTPTNYVNAGGGELGNSVYPMKAPPLGVPSRAHFGSIGGAAAAAPSIDSLHLGRRSPFELDRTESPHSGTSDCRVLRRFFDDWPRPMAESGAGGTHIDLMGSSASLSMSTQENSASDVSLKLSTGSGSEEASAERDRTQLNWMAQWGQHQAGPMGGPLAEALRSSATPAAELAR
uniref:Growth-regulating factor n=1 Tax=Kalanchoe fedtschenkoi TaxID=63787 RepID=A0A7N1A4L1_KALFE